MMGMGGQGSGGVENCTFLEGVDQDTLQTVVEQSNDIRAESYERMALERDVIAEDVKDSVEDQEQRRRSLRDELRSNLGSILMTGTLKRAPANREQNEQADTVQTDKKPESQPEQSTAKTVAVSPEVPRSDRTRLLAEAAALLQQAEDKTEDKLASIKPSDIEAVPDVPAPSKITANGVEQQPPIYQNPTEPTAHETIIRLEQASDVREAETETILYPVIETATPHESVPTPPYEASIASAEPQALMITPQETVLYDQLVLEGTDHEHGEEMPADEDVLSPAITDSAAETVTDQSELPVDMDDLNLTEGIDHVAMEQQTIDEEPTTIEESTPYDTESIRQADELFTRIEALLNNEVDDEHGPTDSSEDEPVASTEMQSDDQAEISADDLSGSLAQLSESIAMLHEMRQVQNVEDDTAIIPELTNEVLDTESSALVSTETDTQENVPPTDDIEVELMQEQVIAKIRASVTEIYLAAYGEIDEAVVERLVALMTSEDYSSPIKELIDEDGPQLHERGTHEQLQWFMANIRNLRYVSRDLHRFIGRFAASHIRPLETAA